MPDKVQRLFVCLGIFNQDIYNQVRLTMLLSKVSRLLVVPALSAHGNCRVQVKLEIPRGLDELFQLLDVLELSIAVEQQRGVI